MTENNKEPFGRILLRERKRQKLSQGTLAKALGVTQPTIGKWERGESEPRFSELAGIFRTLNRDFGFFLGRTDDRSIRISGPVQNVVGDGAHDNAQSIALSTGDGAGAASCPECARRAAEIERLTRECERLTRECERAAERRL